MKTALDLEAAESLTAVPSGGKTVALDTTGGATVQLGRDRIDYVVTLFSAGRAVASVPFAVPAGHSAVRLVCGEGRLAVVGIDQLDEKR